MNRAWLFAFVALFASHAMATDVVDLASSPTTARIGLQQVTRAAATETAQDGVQQRRYTFQPSAQPQITITPAQGAWNWSGQGELHLRV